MTGVRLLIGTQKGAFTATADGTRREWELSGPLFGGWEVYHVAGSPADADRLYASQSTGWFGQILQRSDDGGASWQPVSNAFSYRGEVGTHQWYDGTPHPWEFARVWHLEPSDRDPDTVLAGVEDAALFRTTDGGENWSEVAGLRTHPTGSGWQPGAGGMAVHTVLVHPGDPERIHVAISAAGVFRTDDGGATWRPANRGLHVPQPDRRQRVRAAYRGPAATALLRERAPRRDGGRHPRPVRAVLRHHRRAGVRVGRRRRLLDHRRPRPATRPVGGGPGPAVIRVVLPRHLRTLAGVDGEVCLAVDEPVTQRRLLDALEADYPALRGTVRHPDTLVRRPFVRFFACEADLSNGSPDEPLPDEIAEGREPFHVVGAMAGG